MKLPKYRKLADQLERAIVEGRLLPGARLPSVRELMHGHQISLATATSALRLLEEKGLIEARAKSGYFVKLHRPAQPQEPSTAPSVDGQVRYWIPAEDLFPQDRLKKLTASLVRRYPHLLVRPIRQCNHPALVAELVKRSAESGCILREEEILITQGPEEALSLALRSLLRPGDSILVQTPMTPWLRASLAVNRLQPLLFESGAQLLDDLRRLLSRMEVKPRVALVNASFHCPTGYLMPLQEKREFLRLAEHHGLVVIEDDLFGDLSFEGPRPLPIKSYDLSGRVIYMNACCRSLAPGLELAWLAVSNPRLRHRLESLKLGSSSAVSELMQRVLAEFLNHGSHLPHLRKLRGKLKERSLVFFDTLAPALGPAATLSVPDGAYTCYLPLPKPIDEAERKIWLERWPALFEQLRPVVAFSHGGLCFNTSHALSDSDRNGLRELGLTLRGFLEQVA